MIKINPFFKPIYPFHGVPTFYTIVFFLKFCDECFAEIRYLSNFATQFMNTYLACSSLTSKSYNYFPQFSCV
jgi:hypothetical protein